MAEEKKDKNQEGKDKKGKKKGPGFEPSVLIGWVVGLILVFLAILFNAGASGVKYFIDPASVLIVIGGTIAAVVVNFTFKETLSTFKILKNSFQKGSYDYAKTVEMFVDMAKKARKQGLLSLEDDLKTIEDKFVHKGIKLAIDGYTEDEIRAVLEAELISLEERHLKGHDLFEKAGDFAPAWGMIGTLVGLVLMLQNLSDPANLGPSMAVAMLTTLYGALLANLFIIPTLGKLQNFSNEELSYKKFIIDCVCELQKGQNTSKMKMKLGSYFKVEEKKKKDKKGKDGKGDKEGKENG